MPDSPRLQPRGTMRPGALADDWRIAQAFHETYELLAPIYGYSTREESRTTWEDVPEANRGLMCATVRQLLRDGTIKP